LISMMSRIPNLRLVYMQWTMSMVLHDSDLGSFGYFKKSVTEGSLLIGGPRNMIASLISVLRPWSSIEVSIEASLDGACVYYVCLDTTLPWLNNVGKVLDQLRSDTESIGDGEDRLWKKADMHNQLRFWTNLSSIMCLTPSALKKKSCRILLELECRWFRYCLFFNGPTTLR
jgi:hypothetical protein